MGSNLSVRVLLDCFLIENSQTFPKFYGNLLSLTSCTGSPSENGAGKLMCLSLFAITKPSSANSVKLIPTHNSNDFTHTTDQIPYKQILILI